MPFAVLCLNMLHMPTHEQRRARSGLNYSSALRTAVRRLLVVDVEEAEALARLVAEGHRLHRRHVALAPRVDLAHDDLFAHVG